MLIFIPIILLRVTTRSVIPEKASRGKDTRKKVHYYNGSLKGIFKLGQAQKFSVGMEYVKETLMSATDDLDGENMYTMLFSYRMKSGCGRIFRLWSGCGISITNFLKTMLLPMLS